MIALALAACAHGARFPPDEVARPASDLPSRFEYDATDFSPDSLPTGLCRSPMMDPRDHTKLVLVRIVRGQRADFEVPDGRYGVKAGELLRLNCRTSATIGIVPR
jgi:hypothetical protein